MSPFPLDGAVHGAGAAIEAWVCCDAPECGKWRRVPSLVAREIGDDEPWFCRLSADAKRNACSFPQELENDDIDRRIEAAAAAERAKNEAAAAAAARYNAKREVKRRRDREYRLRKKAEAAAIAAGLPPPPPPTRQKPPKPSRLPKPPKTSRTSRRFESRIHDATIWASVARTAALMRKRMTLAAAADPTDRVPELTSGMRALDLSPRAAPSVRLAVHVRERHVWFSSIASFGVVEAAVARDRERRANVVENHGAGGSRRDSRRDRRRRRRPRARLRVPRDAGRPGRRPDRAAVPRRDVPHAEHGGGVAFHRRVRVLSREPDATAVRAKLRGVGRGGGGGRRRGDGGTSTSPPRRGGAPRGRE